MKICTSCHEEKPKSAFSKNARRKDGLQTVCKQCKRLYNRSYYTSHKQEHLDKNTRIRQRNRAFLSEVKSNSCCAECGEHHPATLQFHHLDGTDKDETISTLCNSLASINRIKAEMAKCIILCANCHAIEHWG